MTLFRWFIVRALRRDPARGLVTVAGLTLGVAVVVAIRLANAASVRGFEAALDVVAGQTSLEILGVGVGVPEDQLAGMGWLREYGRVSPVIDRNARLETADGTGHRLRVLGVDVLRDRPFREYQLLRFSRQGRPPRPQELLDVLLDSTSIVLTERFARRHRLDVGSPVRLVVGDAVHGMTVRGLLLDEGPARVVDGRLALLDIAAAQWRFDGLGWVDRVEIQLFDASAVDAAEREIAARLPAGLRVQRPAERGRQVERMLAAFHFNLSALSWIALIVGLFLVYNTVAVSVISRRAEIGVLRALGATRRLVLGLFLGEAAVLAALAAALGAPAAWVLARAAVALTSTTVNTLYVTSQAVVPPLGAADLALAAAVAVPLALAAAAMPAAEAAGVTPVAAVRAADGGTGGGRFPRRAALVAAGLFVAGGWLSTLDAVGGLPVFGLAAALAVVFGAAALVPVLLDGLRRRGRALLASRFRIEGLLAHANLSAAVSRLAVSVAALAVSLAMLAAIAIMVGSFRETVAYWVGQTLQADLFVSVPDGGRVGPSAGVSEAAERRIASHPAVVAVDGFRSVDLPYGPDGDLIVLGAGRFDVLLEHGALLFKAPADGPAAMRAAIDAGEIDGSDHPPAADGSAAMRSAIGAAGAGAPGTGVDVRDALAADVAGDSRDGRALGRATVAAGGRETPADGPAAGEVPADGPAAAGEIPAAARRVPAADAVVVSESFAIKHRAAVGDRIELDTPRGPRPFRVAAVYYDYSSDRGLVVMDEPTFARHYGPRRPAGLTLYLAPGADPETVRDELLAAAGADHRLFIRTNRTLRAEVLRIFDATFAVTYALQAIAIVVAILGVAATLLTLVLERRRELAVLRLVGAGRRQIRRMVVIEAAMIGLLSQGVGLAVGVGLSLILIYVINVQSFGWTIQFHLPVGFLAQSTVLIAATTALAGLYPARVASRVAAGAER